MENGSDRSLLLYSYHLPIYFHLYDPQRNEVVTNILFAIFLKEISLQILFDSSG